MSRVIKIGLILWLGFTNLANASLPYEDLFFRVLKMQDGLPGSTILCITQDQFGFIWIGTNDGLCRFDGAQFKIYRHDPGDLKSLSDNYIQNLFFDSSGGLWILTASGLDYLNQETQELTHYRHSEESGSLADDSPIAMAETADGQIFIASYYKGISWKKSGDKQFRYLTEEESGLSSNWINCIELLDESTLLIGYRDFGIDIFDFETKTVHPLEELIKEPLASYRINAIAGDGSGGFWLGTNDGLSHVSLIKKEILNIKYNNGDGGFLPDNDIISIYQDKQGFLWIGSRFNGLAIVHADDVLKYGENAPAYSYPQSNSIGGLSYRSISTIFEDKNEKIWIGTHGGGINLVENRLERFNILTTEKGVPKTLSYNKVWGITEDNSGRLWLGTDGDGINVWEPGTGVIKHFKNEKSNPFSLSDDAVISACTDRQGQVWLGTYEGGLNRYNPATNRFYHYQAPKDVAVNDIRCIYEDSAGELWIGMNGGGVAKYDLKNDKFVPLAELQGYDVRTLLRDENTMWIGTFGSGLLRFKLDIGEIKNYYPEEQQVGSISSPTIFSIYQQNDSILFLGTRYGGLAKLNSKNERFEIFTEKDGLANNTVHCILADARKNLWLSTNNGISKFDMAKKSFTNYGWQSGVQSEEFHNGSGLVTRSGLFCFGGIQGLNYFWPNNLQTPRANDNIQFTGLQILGNAVLPQTGGIIEKSIEFRPRVNLDYKHSVVTIEFQAVKNTISEKVQYEYKLEGYETGWNKAGAANNATYRNLPPGDYVFRVKSADSNEIEPGEEAKLLLTMSPPYWKTWWAYLLYFFLVVMAITLVFRYRVQQYKIKNRLAYEQRLRNEEKKLHNERLEFFTNISHELRTPLTIISVAIDELKAIRLPNPKFKKSLEAAGNNSNRLMELINRLMEFRQTETGVSSMTVKKVNLNAFIPEYLKGFREMAHHNSINLRVTLPINSVFLWVDVDKLSMILNNLLSNAFKHTPSGGHILLSVDENEKHVVLIVEDDGEGIAPQFQDKIFKRYFKLDTESTSTGVGLALTKSLVELHKADISVESSLGKGACFTIRFLKGNRHFASAQLIQDENLEELTLSSVESDEETETSIQEIQQKIILIIDDNHEILELLRDKFSDEYHVLTAVNGKEGVELARKYIPDLVLSDIMMPVMNGIEACRELKNDDATCHIPVIMLTAKGAEEDEIKGLETGADDYISKPFKINVLMARVRSMIENRIKISNYFFNKTDVEKDERENLKNEKELAFLKHIEDYILANYLEAELSVFDLAAQLGYSRTTLYRKIKTLTGESINGFVRSVKLKQSARLIQEGYNVSEAAYSAGFNDLKYFRESFKKLYGKNPSEYKS